MKKVISLAIVAAIACLVLVSTASAHVGVVSISCDGVTFSWSQFPVGPSTVNYSVTVDGASAASGSKSIGSSGSQFVPLSLTGPHTITGSSSWTADGGGSASKTEYIHCEGPPPPPYVPCPDGGPHDGEHDGVPGNDDCVHPVPPTPPTVEVVPPVVTPPPTVITKTVTKVIVRYKVKIKKVVVVKTKIKTVYVTKVVTKKVCPKYTKLYKGACAVIGFG